MPVEIDAQIEAFRGDLRKMSVDDLVNRYVLHGECYIIDEPTYFELKKVVSEQFNIHPSQVYMVGSGKMGFSLKRTRRYHPFGDSSDLDLAIVSDGLFDEIWMEAFRFKRDGGYWEKEREFKDYLFRGWIRPDLLPASASFERTEEWWEFFRELTSSGNFGSYKISAGLYRAFEFLMAYQSISVSECKEAEA